MTLGAFSGEVASRCSDSIGKWAPTAARDPDAAITWPFSEVNTTIAAPMRVPPFSSAETSVLVSRSATASRNA
jgi:hypothetical protein